MDLNELSAALHLETPWYPNSAEASQATRSLYIGLAYAEDCHFTCPRCGSAECSPELSWPRIWFRDDFFGYRTFLLARMPDLGCEHCGIVPAVAGWEGPELGFTLMTSNPAREGLAEWRAAGPSLGVEYVS